MKKKLRFLSNHTCFHIYLHPYSQPGPSCSPGGPSALSCPIPHPPRVTPPALQRSQSFLPGSTVRRYLEKKENYIHGEKIRVL